MQQLRGLKAMVQKIFSIYFLISKTFYKLTANFQRKFGVIVVEARKRKNILQTLYKQN